jgi:hypothetical protein
VRGHNRYRNALADPCFSQAIPCAAGLDDATDVPGGTRDCDQGQPPLSTLDERDAWLALTADERQHFGAVRREEREAERTADNAGGGDGGDGGSSNNTTLTDDNDIDADEANTWWEISSVKRNVNFRYPSQWGMQILQGAKIVWLNLVYGFLQPCMRDEAWELLSGDT